MENKMRFIIELEPYEEMYELEDRIVTEAASKMLSMAFNTVGDTLVEKLENKANELLGKMLSASTRDQIVASVTKNLTDKIASRMEKTKIYKDAIAGYDIEPDAVIKTGLKDIVSELVKADLRRTFNQK